MKRLIIFTYILISVCITCNAFSFEENIKRENNNIGFGFHFGAIGQRQDLGLQIFMGHISYKGFYLDFGGWPQSHGSDVRIDKWDADRAFLIHVGYIIPITSFIRITPLIGYASNESGITNGYNWTTTSNGIHNEFIACEKYKGFDYGTQLTINIKHFNIHGTLTRYAWYGGIGYEFFF